ncbi:MAG: SpoIIE family protein phosphatase [Clostridiales bacterium]|nr:SpoIIE family protein phosphatase [Clostridiales bacterium]
MPESKKRIRRPIGLKMTLLFVLFALLFCLALGFFSYRASWEAYTDTYARKALQVAHSAALFVDGDRIGTYLESMETDDYYDELLETLNSIKREFDLMYLYIFKPEDETNIIAIMEAELESDDPKTLFELGEKYTYDGVVLDYDEAKKIILHDEHYGSAVFAYVPVYSSSGELTAMVGAEVSLAWVREMQADFFKTMIILSCVITILMVAGLMLVSRRMISKPLKRLTGDALSFASGDSLSTFENNIKTGDEIQALSEAFGKMACDLAEYIDNLQTVTAERERIGAELDVATKIQASMLPCIFPAYPERDEFDIYADMIPAKEVGGDFYDFFLIDDNTLAVVIADVSGKGVPAALFMVIAKTLLKNNAQAGKSPKEVFDTVNNMLCENNEANMFVTAFMGYLDIASGKLSYVSAGHEPPLIMPAGGDYDWLPVTPALVLAGMDDVQYTQGEVMLQPGDVLFLYTDGVTEAMNTERKQFTSRRLLDAANKHKDRPPKELLAAIKQEIDLFAEGAEQFDDITMLALKTA